MNRVPRCHRLLNVPNGHPTNGARVFTKRQGAVAPRRRFDSNLDSRVLHSLAPSPLTDIR